MTLPENFIQKQPCDTCGSRWGKDKFHCEHCHESFIKITDDREALKEFYDIHHPSIYKSPIGHLCDDCHILFMKWFQSLTEEQKFAMREG